MPMRVCTILSPHTHPAGAEGGTIITHNTDLPSDPDEEIGEEPDEDDDADEE